MLILWSLTSLFDLSTFGENLSLSKRLLGLASRIIVNVFILLLAEWRTLRSLSGMDFRYKIYPQEHLVVYRVDGLPELEDVKRMYLSFVNDPLYSQDFNGIADWRHVTSNLTREDVHEIAEFVLADKGIRKLWVALLAKPLSTALATVYSQKVSGLHPVEICSTLKRASEILGRDVEPFLL